MTLRAVAPQAGGGGGGSGTVTAVGLQMPSSTFVVSNTPVTESGTITVTYVSQAAGTILAAPTGAAGVPSFRLLGVTDIPNLSTTKITSGVFDPARLGTGTATNVTYLNGDGVWKQISYTELSNTPTIPAAQVNSDWNATSGVAQILNKPTIPAAQIQSDWTQTNPAALDFIKNKPVVGSGSVTSVDMLVPDTLLGVSGGPITTSGTFNVTLPARPANQVFAGPVSGATAAPTFRSLVLNDIPALTAAKTTSGVFTTARLGAGTAAANTYLNGGGIWKQIDYSEIANAPGPGGQVQSDWAQTDSLAVDFIKNKPTITNGTVTSVAATVPSEFTVTGTPITTAGTLAINKVVQPAGTVWAGPTTGANAAPNFRALVDTDIPSLDAAKITTGTFNAARIPNLDAAKITTGTFATARIPNLDAAKITTGTFPVARGGTGASTLTANGILVGNGTSAVSAIAPVAAGSRLVSTGTGSAPVWQAPLYAQVYLSANQSVTAGVATKIAFDTVQTDPAGIWNAANSRFIPNRAGTYRVSGTFLVGSTTASAGNTFVWYIRKNGSTYAQNNLTSDFVGAFGSSSTFNVLVSMNGSTDYIEGFVLVSGTSTTVTGNPILLTHMGIEYIGP